MGQLPGWVAIERLNPDITNTFLLIGVCQSISIRGPVKPAVMCGQIANQLRLPTRDAHDRNLVNRGGGCSVNKSERFSIRRNDWFCRDFVAQSYWIPALDRNSNNAR